MAKFKDVQPETEGSPSGDPPFAPTNTPHDSERLSAMNLPEIAAKNPIAPLKLQGAGANQFAGQRKLTVSLKRLPGREPEILFGLEQIELPDSELEQETIFDEMTAQLVAQHTHFINAILPNLPRTLTTGATTTTDAATGEKTDAALTTYEVDRLIKSKRKTTGKIEYKVASRTGKFSQYGIVAYPEKLKLWGLSGAVDNLESVLTEGAVEIPRGVIMHVDERGQYPVLVKLTGKGTAEPF